MTDEEREILKQILQRIEKIEATQERLIEKLLDEIIEFREPESKDLTKIIRNWQKK